LPPADAPPPGYQVVPRPEAQALVAYLRSLKAEPVFYEVFPPPPPRPATNEVAAAATNQPPAVEAGVATNAPVAK
jgi:hypothetical protein